MLILPTEKSIPKVNNPKLLILFGKPKSGKSTLMAALDNNLIIDLENGYQALSALVVQARSVKDFAEIANAVREKIKELGCNKVAYGHHKDDVVETLLLSMIFEGRLHCFAPVTYLDRMDLTVIRPLLYVNEADIIGFKNKMELPVAKSPCPMDGYTKREYAKDLVKQLNQDHPGAKERIFRAIVNGNIKGWEKNKEM